MKIDYSKRRHESPFDETDAPKNESPPSRLKKGESPFAENAPPKNLKIRDSSEKALLRVFAGFVFLVFGIGVSVWAYWCLMGRAYYGDHERGRLEGALCAVISLISFAVAARFFVRARGILPQIKAEKLNYAPLDAQTIPNLPGRIAVRRTRFQTILGFGLAAFFGFLTIVNVSQLLTSRFTTTADIIYKGVLLHGLIVALVSVLVFLLIRAKRKSVRFLDASGVTRGDGRHFAWSDFRGTRTRTGTSRYALIYVWRVELVFADGETAWLIPQRVKNSSEVFGFVNRLPTAVPKEPSSIVES